MEVIRGALRATTTPLPTLEHSLQQHRGHWRDTGTEGPSIEGGIASWLFMRPGSHNQARVQDHHIVLTPEGILHCGLCPGPCSGWASINARSVVTLDFRFLAFAWRALACWLVPPQPTYIWGSLLGRHSNGWPGFLALCTSVYLIALRQDLTWQSWSVLCGTDWP